MLRLDDTCAKTSPEKHGGASRELRNSKFCPSPSNTDAEQPQSKESGCKKKVDTFHFSQPGYLSSWVRAPYPPSMAVIYFGKASVRLSSCQRQTFASSAWERMFYRGFFSQSLGFITVLGALHTEINYHKCRHLFLCRWAVILCVSSAWKFFFF